MFDAGGFGEVLGEVAPEAKALHDPISDLIGLDLDAISDRDLVATIVDARRSRDRLDAALARLTGWYAASRVWAETGAKSAAAHLSAQRGEPRVGCARDVRLARGLGEL